MSKRRKKVIISLLLCFVLIFFAYVRKEIFFQQAKNLIKQNLEKNLPCQLSIGKIRAGLFYGLVLEKLEINFPQDYFGLVFNIKVEQAFVDYNLWQNVFMGRKNRDLRTLRLISPDINLSYLHPPLDSDPAPTTILSRSPEPLTQHKTVLGEFAFVLEDGRISFGNTPVLIKDLQGRLLLSQKDLYFQDIRATFEGNPQNTLKIYGQLSEDQLILTANLEHLKTGNFDILSNLALTLDRKFDLQDKTPKTCGTLKTYGSVFNNRPIPELNSSFEIQDSKLRILTFSLGEQYDLRGIVSLTPPFNADLSLNFHQAAPNELISQFSLSEQPDLAGLLNGLIKITGALGHPKVDGYLEAKEGRIGDLDFVSADINIKGQYPRILIVDSRICREEDFFIMEGEIDFANLESKSFMDIRLKADKGMLWQGWDITRKRDNQMHMSKNIADDFKITFDTFADDDSKGYESNYTNELGLEYKIFGDKLLKLRLRKEEEILGLERRVKF